MNKLKSIDFKAFFLNHGEKLGFGAAVLLAISVLGMANWSTYDKQPVEFQTKAEQAERELAQSQWPEEDKTKDFALLDFTAMRDEQLRNLDEDPYRYIVEMSPKLYPRDAQYKEPILVPVEKLLVYNGRTAIYTQPPKTETESESTTGAESQDVASGSKTSKKASATPLSELESEFAAKPASRPAAGIPADAAHVATPAEDPAMMAAAHGADMMHGDPAMYGDMSMIAMAPTSNRTGRGLRYNSVVGIVPHRKMMDAFKIALHEASPEEAAKYIQYRDFKIERRRQLPGNDQWTDWQALNVEAVIEAIKNEWDLWDEEVVSVLVTDPVFTMPLPPRAMGRWDVHVTHPDMRKYMLSQEQLEEERKKNEAAAAALLAKQEKAKSGGGFSGLSLDLGGARRAQDAMHMAEGVATADGMDMRTRMQSSMMMQQQHADAAASSHTMDSSMTMMMQSGSHGPMPGSRGGALLVSGPANTSDYLLFRYIDFEIEPGQTYQYRVQLSVRNPSFGMPLEQVEKPEVADGETRETPWSAPSPPTAVEDDVKFFVNQVPRRNGRPINQVAMDVVQWDTALGTLEQYKNLSVNFGQHIGGSVRTDRLDVIKETLEERADVLIFGHDMLVDASAAPIAVATEHPDLVLTQRDMQTQLNSGNLDEAITVDANGQLEVTTKVEVVQDQAHEEARYKAQMQAFEKYRDKEEEAAGGASSLDAYAAELGMSNSGSKDAKNKNKRRVNPAAMMMQMMHGGSGGMHGMMPPPNQKKRRNSGH
jgi:hypothetical protein